jgi:hypothetical protein
MQAYVRTFIVIIIAVVSSTDSLLAQHSGISMAPADEGVLSTSSSSPRGSYYTFYRATMSQDVQNTSPNNPINETTNFLPTDSIALAWSHLINLYKPVRLKAVWIAPNSQEYATNIGSWSGDPAASGYLYWAWWKFWAWIRIKDFPPEDSTMWGTWTVKMYMEENYFGTWNLESTMTFQITGPTSVQTLVIKPSTFVLSQNYPNPFNPSTIISYALPLDSKVVLNIYNTLGQKVALLKDEIVSAGNYEVNFNASHLSSGIYFYSITAQPLNGGHNFREAKKMIMMK